MKAKEVKRLKSGKLLVKDENGNAELYEPCRPRNYAEQLIVDLVNKGKITSVRAVPKFYTNNEISNVDTIESIASLTVPKSIKDFKIVIIAEGVSKDDLSTEVIDK